MSPVPYNDVQNAVKMLALSTPDQIGRRRRWVSSVAPCLTLWEILNGSQIWGDIVMRGGMFVGRKRHNLPTTYATATACLPALEERDHRGVSQPNDVWKYLRICGPELLRVIEGRMHMKAGYEFSVYHRRLILSQSASLSSSFGR